MPIAPPTKGTAALDERELLRRYHVHGDASARRELVERMLPMVRHLARRYVNRGESLDDLEQVGCVGLLKAIDRFDLRRDVKLATFAAPNISGEIKRYFRDRSWSVRVPRDIQELNVEITAVTERLTGVLGRSPTIDELAQAVGAPRERVLDALQGAQAYTAMSLDDLLAGSRETLDALGGDDAGYELVEQRALLRPGLAELRGRELQILRMRFFEGLTQREIAEQLGISQMHVSRLLRRALREVHTSITVGVGSAQAAA